MTGTYVVADQLAMAKKWVGFHEGGNNIQPFSFWQFDGEMRNLSWCASFFCYCCVEGGDFRYDDHCQCGYKGDAYCPFAVDTARRMGIWRAKTTRAQPGWGAIFSWTGQQADHEEMVVSDTGTTFVTIGGNTNDMVTYRVRDRRYLMGWVALDQAHQTSTAPPPPTTEGMDVRPTDKMDACLRAQGGRYVVAADGGVFGYDGAPFFGSVPGEKPRPTITMGKNHASSILVTPTGKGYWVLLWDGGIHGFGDAAFHGNFLHDTAVEFGNGALKLIPSNDNLQYRAIRALDGKVLRPR